MENTRSVYQANYEHPGQGGFDTLPEVVYALEGPSPDVYSALHGAWFRLHDEAEVVAESLTFPDFLGGENLLPKMFYFKKLSGKYADLNVPPKKLSGKWEDVRKNLSWDRITKLLLSLGYPPAMIRDQEQHWFKGSLLIRVKENCWNCEPDSIAESARIAVHSRNRQIRDMRKKTKLTTAQRSAAA